MTIAPIVPLYCSSVSRGNWTKRTSGGLILRGIILADTFLLPNRPPKPDRSAQCSDCIRWRFCIFIWVTEKNAAHTRSKCRKSLLMTYAVPIMMLVGIFLFSVAIPVGILIGRENIRAFRKDIVRDLQKLFEFAKTSDGKLLIIPSFELVKYKYDPPDTNDSPCSLNKEPTRGSTKSSYLIYTISVSIYAGTAFLGMLVLFWETAGDHHTVIRLDSWNSIFLDASNFFSKQPADGAIFQTLSIIGFAFLGGYIYSILYLLRRVANFDLSPLSFFRASIHIFQGSSVAAVLFHAGHLVLDSYIGSGQLAAAFLIGWLPDLGIRTIASKFPSLQMKTVPKAAKDIGYDLPLDLICGIDAFIRYRLAEFEIDDVQNLATANPIQIFVETPYGLYEAIDWVAQAQLIVAVGVDKISNLRKLNIRTVFDLEKSICSPLLRAKTTKALLPDLSNEELKTLPSGPTTIELALLVPTSQDYGSLATSRLESFPGDPLTAIVCAIYDDLHVRRLRQICDVISQRLAERPTIVISVGRVSSVEQGLAI